MAKSSKSEPSLRPPTGAGKNSHSYPVIKPKPAGTLLILDEQDGQPHVLMGRRHKAHNFMPGVFVFPGGRVDRHDNFAPYHGDLTAPTLERLLSSGLKSLATARRARAFALAAIRETFEEVGMLVGKVSPEEPLTQNSAWKPILAHGQLPDMEHLRFVARAVTPPGLIRRYDTRFFTVTRDEISLQLPECPTDELSELSWVPLSGANAVDVPRITKLVLKDVAERVASEGTIKLRDDQPVPDYSIRNGKQRRQMV